MKILGVDPGLNITGFGVIVAAGLRFSYVASGRIKSAGDVPERVCSIFESMRQVMEKHAPDVVVVERVFMRPDRPNPDAAIKLGHARGAIIAAAGMDRIAVAEYSPNQIKKSLVGRGHADKKQVVFMVGRLLRLEKTPTADAADALAAAICHAYHLL